MKQWTDLNQSTLRVMCNIMQESYALSDLTAKLEKLTEFNVSKRDGCGRTVRFR